MVTDNRDISLTDGSTTVTSDIEYLQFSDLTITFAEISNPKRLLTDITLDVTSVSENAEGVHIANLFGTDPNAGDQLSYSIIGGENADMFETWVGQRTPCCISRRVYLLTLRVRTLLK